MSPEKKVIINANSYSDKAWILKCITGTTSGNTYTGHQGNVGIQIAACSLAIKTISYSSMNDCQAEITTPVSLNTFPTVNSSSDGANDSKGAFTVVEANTKWFIVAFSAVIILVAIVVSIVCFRKRKNENVRDQRQESINNPMYGMSEYYGYDKESRIEKTNPDYDAYYKEDYDSTNITDDNEMYGKEDK